eukprot:SAG31_NODE_4525_length_3165_cov_1.986301_1_plen_214_part_10
MLLKTTVLACEIFQVSDGKLADIKMFQMAALLTAAHRNTTTGGSLLGKPAVIVAGDFNSLPGSAAVDLATVEHPFTQPPEGWVQRDEAGLAAGMVSHPLGCGDDEASTALYKEALIATQALELASVYDPPAAFTNYTVSHSFRRDTCHLRMNFEEPLHFLNVWLYDHQEGFVGTLDWIFYSPTRGTGCRRGWWLHPVETSATGAKTYSGCSRWL